MNSVRTGQSGQTLIESVVLMPILFVGVTTILGSVLMLTQSMILHHHLYQAALCTQLFPTPKDCKSKFQSKIENSIFFATPDSLKFKSYGNAVGAEISLQSSWFKTWTVQESIALPLVQSEGHFL